MTLTEILHLQQINVAITVANTVLICGNLWLTIKLRKAQRDIAKRLSAPPEIHVHGMIVTGPDESDEVRPLRH